MSIEETRHIAPITRFIVPDIGLPIEKLSAHMTRLTIPSIAHVKSLISIFMVYDI